MYELCVLVFYTIDHSIYIRTVSSLCMLSTLLNQIKLVYGLFGQEQDAQYTLFLPQTIQKGNECTTTYYLEKLRVYCPNIYTVLSTQHCHKKNFTSIADFSCHVIETRFESEINKYCKKVFCKNVFC